jgi:hypothetical protein
MALIFLLATAAMLCLYRQKTTWAYRLFSVALLTSLLWFLHHTLFPLPVLL